MYSQKYVEIMKATTRQLEQKVDELLVGMENTYLKIYHVNHKTKRYGLQHFHKYDTTKYNGMTLGILHVNGQYYVIPAICSVEDEYLRPEGKAIVLTRLQTALKSDGLENKCLYKVDWEEAFQHFNAEINDNRIVRGIVDWFIKTHVNKPKVAKTTELVINRSCVAALEKQCLERLQKVTGLKCRIIYSYNEDQTTLTFVADRKEEKHSEDVYQSIDNTLKAFSRTVTKYKKSLDNRLVARYHLLTV